MLCGLLDVPEQQHAFGGCQPIANYPRHTYVTIITGLPLQKYIDWVTSNWSGSPTACDSIALALYNQALEQASWHHLNS